MMTEAETMRRYLDMHTVVDCQGARITDTRVVTLLERQKGPGRWVVVPGAGGRFVFKKKV